MKVVNFLLILLVGSLLLLPLGVNAQDNILQNPSFEDSEHLNYWVNDGTATFIWVEKWHPKEGKWSFGVGNDLDWAQGNAWGRCIQVLKNPDNPDELYPVTEGEVLNFSMYLKGENGYKGEASLKIEFFDYNREDGFLRDPIKTLQSNIYKGEPKWTWIKLNVSGTVPKGTVSIMVSGVSEKMAKGSKYIWFDDGYVSIATPQ